MPTGENRLPGRLHRHGGQNLIATDGVANGSAVADRRSGGMTQAEQQSRLDTSQVEEVGDHGIVEAADDDPAESLGDTLQGEVLHGGTHLDVDVATPPVTRRLVGEVIQHSCRVRADDHGHGGVGDPRLLADPRGGQVAADIGGAPGLEGGGIRLPGPGTGRFGPTGDDEVEGVATRCGRRRSPPIGGRALSGGQDRSQGRVRYRPVREVADGSATVACFLEMHHCPNGRRAEDRRRAETATMPSERTVTFPAPDGVTMVGTLAEPDGVAPHPAALLLVGSGEIDRDSDNALMPLGVTRELAAALGQAGIASLRYDKRGVGASAGSYVATTFADAREDGAAALDFLRGEPSVDPQRVLIIGHSEGALHAISIAAADDTLAGIGLLAASAVTGEATMRWQARRILPTLPRFLRGLLRLLRQTPDRTQEKLFARVRGSDAPVLRVQWRQFNAGWLREFIDHDPVPELARLSVPVFALTGDRDLQVNVEDLDVIEKAVSNAPVDVHAVPRLNHLLRRTEGTGSPTDYKGQLQARQPVDERVLDALTRWATEQVGASR